MTKISPLPENAQHHLYNLGIIAILLANSGKSLKLYRFKFLFRFEVNSFSIDLFLNAETGLFLICS